MALARQLDGEHEVSWKTEPVSAELPRGDDARHVFRLPVAMGYRSQPSGDFRLYLGDRELLSFDVSLESETWIGEQSGARLRYHVKANNAEDSTGILEIDVPASLLETGKPATFRVRGSRSQSRRWFGVLLLK